jgi:hypothetical protein
MDGSTLSFQGQAENWNFSSAHSVLNRGGFMAPTSPNYHLCSLLGHSITADPSELHD